MKVVDWKMVVSSRQPVDAGWRDEARRLRSFLSAVSDRMPPVYSGPIFWRDDELTAEQWSDLTDVTAEIERRRMRDDNGTLSSGGSSTGAVQAYRDDASESMINNMWTVGGDDEWRFNAVLTFYAADTTAGRSFPLERHPVEWLVKLLSAASASVNAAQARIETIPLAMELLRARRESVVGGITLAPHGIGDASLPASITAYPCTDGYPDGLVLVADLDRTVNDPASLVDDLLTVDDILLEDIGR